MRLLLVVEDDSDTRSTLGALLSETGYSVCEAADCGAALDKLHSMRPDLVLLDYGIPTPEDGERFLRLKAADSEVAATPVVVVSGYEMGAKPGGAVAMIRKPFDLDQLIGLINRLIGPPQRPDTTAAA
jgi:CheY-like chemotaxis protein